MTDDDPDARLAQAAWLLSTRRPAEAEALLREVLAADPHSATALGLLAQALAAQDRVTEAVTVARAGLTVDPDDLSLALMQCEWLVVLDRSPEARVLADHVAAAFPGAWEAHYFRAMAWLGQPHPRAGLALSAAEEAVRLAPAEPDALSMSGICHEALRERHLARNAYVRAVAEDPQHIVAASRLALLDSHRGKLLGAGQKVSAAMATNPTSSLASFYFVHVVAVMSRWLFGLSFLGVVAVFFLTFERWWIHASVATVFVAVIATVAALSVRSLPRRADRWAPLVWRRASRTPRILIVVGALLFVALLGFGYGPSTPRPSGQDVSDSSGMPWGSIVVLVFALGGRYEAGRRQVERDRRDYRAAVARSGFPGPSL